MGLGERVRSSSPGRRDRGSARPRPRLQSRYDRRSRPRSARGKPGEGQDDRSRPHQDHGRGPGRARRMELKNRCRLRRRASPFFQRNEIETEAAKNALTNQRPGSLCAPYPICAIIPGFMPYGILCIVGEALCRPGRGTLALLNQHRLA